MTVGDLVIRSYIKEKYFVPGIIIHRSSNVGLGDFTFLVAWSDDTISSHLDMELEHLKE